MPVPPSIPVRLLGAVARYWTLVLLPLLLASVVLNVWQWKRAVTAPLRAQNQALGTALTTARGLASDASRDNARLVSDLDALVERGRRTRVVFRHAAASAPLPAQCAPGAERIQAINQGLGPSEPIHRE